MADEPPAQSASRSQPRPARRPSRRGRPPLAALGAASSSSSRCSLRALLGLVIIPAGQRENAGLSDEPCDAPRSGPRGRLAGRRAAAQHARPRLPVSQVSWDPEIMQILAAGNTRARRRSSRRRLAPPAMATRACRRPIFPSLAGQIALRDLQAASRLSHRRPRPSADDRRRQGACGHATSPPSPPILRRRRRNMPRSAAAILSGEQADRASWRWEGDSRRRIPACLSCHVNGVGGPIETPVIIGQSREYMVAAAQRLCRRHAQE